MEGMEGKEDGGNIYEKKQENEFYRGEGGREGWREGWKK